MIERRKNAIELFRQFTLESGEYLFWRSEIVKPIGGGGVRW